MASKPGNRLYCFKNAMMVPARDNRKRVHRPTQLLFERREGAAGRARPVYMKAKRVNIISLKLVRESSLLYRPGRIRGPEDAFELVRNILEDADREIFMVIYLNTKNEPTAIHTVSVGTLNTSLVHPREVFKAAVMVNAASLILAHNHPSGDSEASREDIDITRKLAEAGNILGIQVIDHIIVGSGGYRSLKDAGML